jgi:outer membrane protein
MLVVFAALFFAAMPAFAQNFGFVRSDEVLSKMPQIKEIDSQLNALQKVLQSKREFMIKDLQYKYQELEMKKQQGTIAPKQEEIEMQALQAMQDSVAAYEQSMSAQYNDKKNELLTPVLDQLNKAIDAVAKEGNYQYVFEWGSGVLLYADETKDLTKLIMAKLGIAN